MTRSFRTYNFACIVMRMLGRAVLDKIISFLAIPCMRTLIVSNKICHQHTGILSINTERICSEFTLN